ncbi:MAG: tRNA uridine-5-carboxymethylaminomethyl(34) synthesis GTPase MnmE [Geminicoccaceae bacterium]
MTSERRATIYAPATPPGRSALGVLRISGAAAGLVAERLAGRVPAPRRATLAALRDPASGGLLDRALLLFFPAPGSSTGEDVLEIQHHGGVAVARSLVEVLAAMPELRPAEPGEFTRRAFLAGRLDLTAAEGLADLIDATSAAQAKAALRQMDGALGRRYADWRERLLRALALLEAEIDFAAEEEVPDRLWASVEPDLAALAAELGRHLDDGRRGERLRAGLAIAVIGAPNVGKSSLVNAITQRDVAIVTPFAGTTRDVIEVALDLDGLPVTLLDTAGLRDSEDPIEREGIARAKARAAAADLRLLVVDDPADLPGSEAHDPATLRVLNKLDLCDSHALPAGVIAVSAATGEGLERLLAALAAGARAMLPGTDEVLLTRARHRTALHDALAALERALALGVAGDLGLLAEEVRLAGRALGRITGAFGVEDILDRVFSEFCIGK